MSDTTHAPRLDFKLPRRQFYGQDHTTHIPAPSHDSFSSQFGHVFPKPHLLNSDLGTMAVYNITPPSGTSKRHVLIVHGLNTPALGMWPLAKRLQAHDPDTHVVTFDLWSHGFSSTPIVAHTPQIFHFQIFQVLGYMGWTRAHLMGYSFGGPTVLSFALGNPWMVESVAVLGPAGLLDLKVLGGEMQAAVRGGSEMSDEKAIDVVLEWLEGGPLNLPEDWQERSKKGEVIAEALRAWELREHRGYPHSILNMFREGGVFGREELFRKCAKLPCPKIGVVGENDPVCTQKQLLDLGFEDVQIVEKADHAFVRSAVDQVAAILHRFWTKQAGLSRSQMDKLPFKELT